MGDTQNITFSQLLREPLPEQDVLKYTIYLAEALRQLHDQGTICGELDPANIILKDSVARLARREATGGPSPYAAPEQLEGKSADARSDIFAFGAVVYQMLSGRRAFDGQTREELRAAIMEREPSPLDGVQPGLVKLVTKCLAKSPEKRWQRMQKVVMELKLLNLAARYAEEEAARQDRVETAVRSAIAELEARLSARLASQDGAAEELQRRLGEQEEKLRAAAAMETALRAEIAALEQRNSTRLDACEARIAATENQSREQEARAASASQTAELRQANVSQTLSGIQQTLAAHVSSLESLKSAVAQTDDLVEHVVEAFSLQKPALGRNEAVSVAVSA